MPVDRRALKASRFINKVVRAFQDAYVKESETKGLTRADMARQLGVERSVISRRLTGGLNMTLRSVAEMADVLNRDISFSLIERPKKDGNGLHIIEIKENNMKIIQAGAPVTSSQRALPLNMIIIPGPNQIITPTNAMQHIEEPA